jgi:hypothetical protein
MSVAAVVVAVAVTVDFRVRDWICVEGFIFVCQNGHRRLRTKGSACIILTALVWLGFLGWRIFIAAVAIHHVLLGNAVVCRAQSVGTVPIDDSQVEGENDMEIISPVVPYKHQLPCPVRAADSTL